MASLKISVLNVGHGDFICVRTPLGNNLVIDCGSGGGDVTPSLFLKQISTIDELQISHPHTDHFDDIIGISKKNIRSFCCHPLDKFDDKVIGWRKQDKIKIAKLRQLKQKIGVDNDDVVCNSEFQYTVFSPQNIDYDDANTASFITVLRYGSFKMLFGGDLPDSGWKDLLGQDGFKTAIKGTNIFKVPHHGRQEGCSEELFKYISPQLCIISDKPIDDTNKNTVATDWYTKRSSGANIIGVNEKRKVLSTRNDGSIFIKVDSQGNYDVYPNTRWCKD